MNEVNREKIVSELKSIPGLKGIVACGDGYNITESAILLYYVPEELFFQELDQTISRVDDAGLLIEYSLREIRLVDLAIADCLEGRITIQHSSGHPFGIVNSSYAAEIHYGRILWESTNHPITTLKEKLAMEGPYPEKLRQATIAYFMREAALSLGNGHSAAMQGGIHYASGSFFQAACSWVQVIHALNQQFLLSEKGGLKRANELPISPKQFRVRVNQVYRYFAANNPKLAYCEIDMLENEMNVLVRSFAETREG
ncbi:hypothetical protein [Trichococcus pasteurii]|uniref:Uncharacterized protein n=1 Tax=Trichococcus pasteurii TaxID=43064 RepID=A0A1W1IHC4_9LACT|nr:hypothetical protein [Trichococcus pasteurii]SFE54191.1 hypothetical protein SAMN04488086_105115 [Trichococcus pasteurii]SLM52370.1 Hypothetical protein TPAS_2064 [Trichococcus pasteurii]SSB93251.1 Hypothetical protein TPAS_2064 [Trichococcus pasteurii]